MPKIAFLGAGNMAGAMIAGLLAKQTPCSQLVCYTASGRTAAALAARTGIAQAASPDELLAGADILIVAFKPYHLAAADPRLAELTAGKLVISVLAGKKIAALAGIFPRARAIIRAMPNTPSAIGAGITGWCTAVPLVAGDRALVENFLSALGRAVEIPEPQMDAVTALSGAGPAYLFEFAAALRDAGVAAGLAAEVANTLVVETLLGAARLLAQQPVAAEKLRDAVTSPNGATFAGLQRMAAHDFRGLMRETVLAATTRAAELSNAG